MAAEVTHQLKLAQSAAFRGREYEPKLPAIASIVKGKANPLADMVRSMISDPKAKPSAAPKINTA
eukprot:2915088-Heterocapsa_arctica.AAC.1